MRRWSLILVGAVLAAACSDAGVSPTSPDGLEIRAAHEPGGTTANDECGGVSPCDAFFGGPAGYCFVPPMTNNHNSEAACSALFVPDLPDGLFQLVPCEVDYGPGEPSGVPTVSSCRDAVDFTWDGTSDFYVATTKFDKAKGRNEGDEGIYFRLYVVSTGADPEDPADDTHVAFRDVVVDPNLVSPADEIVLAVGTGKVNVKLRVTESLECDGSEGSVENCLIFSGQSFNLGTLGTNVQFGAVTNPFFLNASLTDCELVDPITGERSHDLARFGCAVDIDGEFSLPEAAEIVICENVGAIPANALSALRVIHQQEGDPNGLSVLPPVPAECGPAAPVGLGGAFQAGLQTLASWFGVEELVATTGMVQSLSGGGGSFRRNSTFELAVVTVNQFYDLEAVTPGPIGDRAVLDLGARPPNTAIPIAVQALTGGPAADPAGATVAGEWVHFFLDGNGSVACDPTTLSTEAPEDLEPGQCETTTSNFGEDASFLTGNDGIAWVRWTPGVGSTSTREVYALTCGAGVYAEASDDTPIDDNLPDGEIQGLHQFCDRDVTAFNGFKNGPNTGLDPFDPVDASGDPLAYEIALNDPELTWQAQTCPTPEADGFQVHPTTSVDEWSAGCATEVASFNAPMKGKKTTGDNTWVLAQTDGTFLYLAMKVRTSNLKDMFWTFDNNGDGAEASGDDQLLLRLKNLPQAEVFDRRVTANCLGSSENTLCGADDEFNDPQPAIGNAEVNTAMALDPQGLDPGTEFVFYEFRRMLNSDPTGAVGNCGEDICVAVGDDIGVRVQVTGGSGGGQAGFQFPEKPDYHPFTIP